LQQGDALQNGLVVHGVVREMPREQRATGRARKEHVSLEFFAAVTVFTMLSEDW
jgi:hypothetical protein